MIRAQFGVCVCVFVGLHLMLDSSRRSTVTWCTMCVIVFCISLQSFQLNTSPNYGTYNIWYCVYKLYSRPSKRHYVSFRRSFFFHVLFCSSSGVFLWCGVMWTSVWMRRESITRLKTHLLRQWFFINQHTHTHTERNTQPIMKIRKKWKKKIDEEKYKRNEITRCSRKWVQFVSFSMSLGKIAFAAASRK